MPFINVFISDETLLNNSIKTAEAIKKYSAEFNLAEPIIKAIIRKESINFIFSYRIDYSNLKNQQWYHDTLTEEQRKYKECYASYGLMQVLFGLARSYGFKGSPLELMNPATNIYYGCKHLDYLRKRYKGKLKDMFHAYNWGSNSWMDYDHDGIHDPNEPYKNQKYVDEVYTYYKSYGGKL